MITGGGDMKKFKKSLILLSWMTIFSVALGAAWTTKRITNNAGISIATAIAVNGANVYVTWQDTTPGNCEIYFRRSTDGGTTWNAAKRLTFNSGYSESVSPDITVNGSTICVAYQGNASGNDEIYCRTSTDGGATWQAAKRLTFNSGDSCTPKIAFSGVSLCLVWWDDTPGNPEIYFRKSTDSGATWQSAQRLSNNSGDSYCPDIVGYGSYLYVVWNDVSSGNTESYFRRSIDSGATWQSQKKLTNNSGAFEGYTSIAVGGMLGANLFAAWHDNAPGNFDIYFRRSTDKGVTWQTIKNLTDNSGNSYCPAIAVSGSNVYVTWQDDIPGNDEIYMRKSGDGGVTWQTSQRITNNSGTSSLPAIALNNSTRYVTFQEDTPGNAEIYLKFSPL